jgi:ABC-type transport system involved in cytochrome c biogenesis permease subunit
MNQLHSGQEVDGAQAIHEADEKMNILLMLFNGQLLKIYPYKSEDEIRWFSQADKLPEELESEENKEQWFFIKKTQDYMAEQAVQENYNKVLEIASKILKYQKQEAEGTLPSNRVFHAEKQYNTIDYTRPMAMAFATIGIILFFIYVRLWIKDKKPSKKLSVPLCIILVLAILYLGYLIGLRGYISGHLPLTNGYETMQFMAFCTLILTLLLYRRYTLIMPYGFLLTGLTLLVSMMGQSNPQITLLMPVLASPLLSIHVCVIMLAYSLMAFCLFNGITALLLPKTPMYDKQIGQLTRMSKLMLYPALFCLTAGIFIGAIWANVSWGRYWGWDPKEVWALITMMVYAVPLHQASIPFLRNPKWFHLYMILAFLSVLFTYFGVNFVLGGMHSYAG